MDITDRLKVFAKEFHYEEFEDTGVELDGWRAFYLYNRQNPGEGVRLLGYPAYALVKEDEIRRADIDETEAVMTALAPDRLEDDEEEPEEAAPAASSKKFAACADG